MINLLVCCLLAAGCLLSAGAEKTTVSCPHNIFGPFPEPINPSTFRKDVPITTYSCSSRGLFLDPRDSEMASDKFKRPTTPSSLPSEETNVDPSSQPAPEDQQTNLINADETINSSPDVAPNMVLPDQEARDRPTVPHLGGERGQPLATEERRRSVSSLEEQQDAPADKKKRKKRTLEEEFSAEPQHQDSVSSSRQDSVRRSEQRDSSGYRQTPVRLDYTLIQNLEPILNSTMNQNQESRLDSTPTQNREPPFYSMLNENRESRLDSAPNPSHGSRLDSRPNQKQDSRLTLIEERFHGEPKQRDPPSYQGPEINATTLVFKPTDTEQPLSSKSEHGELALNLEPKEKKLQEEVFDTSNPNSEQSDKSSEHEAIKENLLINYDLNQSFNAKPNRTEINRSFVPHEGPKRQDSKSKLQDSQRSKQTKDGEPVFAGLANILDPDPTKSNSSSKQNTETQNRSDLVKGLDEILNAMLAKHKPLTQEENPSSRGFGSGEVISGRSGRSARTEGDFTTSTPHRTPPSTAKNFGNIIATSEQRDPSSKERPEEKRLLPESLDKSSNEIIKQHSPKREVEEDKSFFQGNSGKASRDTRYQQDKFEKSHSFPSKELHEQEPLRHESSTKIFDVTEERLNLSSDVKREEMKPLRDGNLGKYLNTTGEQRSAFSSLETEENRHLIKDYLDTGTALNAKTELQDPSPNKSSQGKVPHSEDNLKGSPKMTIQRKHFTKRESLTLTSVLGPADFSDALQRTAEQIAAPSNKKTEEKEPVLHKQIEQPLNAGTEWRGFSSTQESENHKTSSLWGGVSSGTTEQKDPASNQEPQGKREPFKEKSDRRLDTMTELRNNSSAEELESYKPLPFRENLIKNLTEQMDPVSNQEREENKYPSKGKSDHRLNATTEQRDSSSTEETESYRPSTFWKNLSKTLTEQMDSVLSQESEDSKFGNEKSKQPVDTAANMRYPSSTQISESNRPLTIWDDISNGLTEQNDRVSNQDREIKRPMSKSNLNKSTTELPNNRRENPLTPDRENSKHILAKRDFSTSQIKQYNPESTVDLGTVVPQSKSSINKHQNATELPNNQRESSSVQDVESSKLGSVGRDFRKGLTEQDHISNQEPGGKKTSNREMSETRLNVKTKHRDLYSNEQQQETKTFDDDANKLPIDLTTAIEQESKDQKSNTWESLGTGIRLNSAKTDQQGPSHQTAERREIKQAPSEEGIGKHNDSNSFMNDLPPELTSVDLGFRPGEGIDPLTTKRGVTSDIMQSRTNDIPSQEKSRDNSLHQLTGRTHADLPIEDKDSHPTGEDKRIVSDNLPVQSNLPFGRKQKESNTVPVEDELDRLLKLAKAEKLAKSSKAAPPEQVPEGIASDDTGKRKSPRDTQSDESEYLNRFREISMEDRENLAEDEPQGIVTLMTTPPNQGDSRLPGDTIITDDIIIPGETLMGGPESNLLTIAFTADNGSVVDVVYPSSITEPNETDARTDEFEPVLHIGGSQPKVSVSSLSDETSTMSFHARTMPINAANTPLALRAAPSPPRTFPQNADLPTESDEESEQTAEQDQLRQKTITVNKRHKH